MTRHKNNLKKEKYKDEHNTTPVLQELMVHWKKLTDNSKTTSQMQQRYEQNATRTKNNSNNNYALGI